MSRSKRARPPANSDRWFRVTAKEFDFKPSSNVVIAYKRDQIGFGTRACIEQGLQSGSIELIEKPENAYVGKNGKVYFND